MGDSGMSGALFRSELMSYINIYVENDAAHDMVMELGKLGIVEFKDMNAATSAFQRPFAQQIKQCEEMQRRLRLLREAIEHADQAQINPEKRHSRSFQEIDNQLTEWERDFVESNEHYIELKRSLRAKEEEQAILDKCAEIYNFAPIALTHRETEEEPSRVGTLEKTDLAGKVSHICGSVMQDRLVSFQRVIFRVTRGNCIITTKHLSEDSSDSANGTSIDKVAFMIFYSGSVLGQRIAKVADTFGASSFQFPDSATDRAQKLDTLKSEIQDIKVVYDKTLESRASLLGVVSQSLVGFEATVDREKAVYHTLNFFNIEAGRKGMHVEGWCPTSQVPEVRRAVDRIAMERQIPRPIVDEETIHFATSDRVPPTYFPTNKLTSGFQAIVDAYGIANYREFNPMPFTVITFPFLFAVMFGDVGHGLLMFIFAVGMLAKEKYFLRHPPGEIFGICFNGRYVILLMSLFSMYTGMLYNDTFALAFDWWDSGAYSAKCLLKGAGTCQFYVFDNYHLVNGPQCEKPNPPCLPVLNEGAHVYPFGLDPIWKQSMNELSFTNSLKMKMSIVFGVSQMTFGVLLSGLNHIYFSDWTSFNHLFVPQILFLTSVFGFMVVCILVKWMTYYENTHCAPSILTLFIDMFLNFGTVAETEGCEKFAELFPNQQLTEQILIVIAFITVPWMLFARPLILRARHSAPVNASRGSGANRYLLSEDSEEDVHVEKFDFGEEMIHQIIHTIEFVLGAVSNTASYLRLWALSLAHAQLSTVFWEKVMVENMHMGAAVIVPAFVVWTMCTIGVLMVMESLSAFLHALRLHWVEFQNKFYKGSGIAFEPFSFMRLKHN